MNLQELFEKDLKNILKPVLIMNTLTSHTITLVWTISV